MPSCLRNILTSASLLISCVNCYNLLLFGMVPKYQTYLDAVKPPSSPVLGYSIRICIMVKSLQYNNDLIVL